MTLYVYFITYESYESYDLVLKNMWPNSTFIFSILNQSQLPRALYISYIILWKDKLKGTDKISEIVLNFS